MNDEIRRQLEDAGRRPVPAPRPGFTEGLDARLVALAKERGSVVAASPWWRRPRMRLGAGLAAVALAIALVLGNGLGGDRTTLALELIGSVNVEVALVDGTTLVDPDGLLLPEGAVVRVGADGSAHVGRVALGAGDVATVVGGRLQVDRPPGDRVVVSSASPTPSPSPSTPPASEAPRPTPIIVAGSPGTSAPRPSDHPATPAPTRTPLPTDGPARTAEPSTPTPRPDVRPPTAKPAVVALLKIEARAVGPHEIAVTWSGTPGADRYVLIGTVSRDGAAPEPVYPGSRTIGDFTRPPATPLRFRVGDAIIEVRLQVVAVSADGTVVGRSPVATVALGG